MQTNLIYAKEWSFEVFMDKKFIGEHSFNLKEEEIYNKLTSQANFKVTLLSIPVYKYKHISEEIWNKDCLYAIDSNTQDGSDDYKVRGETKDSIFKLIEPVKQSFTKECPMTFSYWNPLMLKQNKLLNVQTGEYVDIQVKSLGKKIIKVKNETIEAYQYSLIGNKININLWYKDNHEWVKLESVTPDNHQISYEMK